MDERTTADTPSPNKELEIEETDEREKERLRHGLLYEVEDVPPFAVTISFALQICIQTVSAAITYSMLTGKAICAPDIATAKIMNTSIFLAGLTTLLQTTLGIRLPIFQGPSVLYVMPLVARAALPDWTCLDTTNRTTALNSTTITDDLQTYIPWESRLSAISGSLMAVSVIHAVLAFTGVVGILTKYIGPLTIAPALILVGLDIAIVLGDFAMMQWIVAAITCSTVILSTCYLARVGVPLPSWNRKNGCHVTRGYIFRPFGIVFAMIFGWTLCVILTVTGALSNDPAVLEYQARTDNKGEVIDRASWFYFPYPGQFGPPSFNSGLFFGLSIAMVTSILDSVADYFVTSSVCRIQKPPPYAVNRGLFVEGVCSILSGAFGAGHATTTYSGLIGNISLTGIASRRVFQLVGIILIVAGAFGKITAFFVTMPKPVVAGFSGVGIASMVGMAISSLEEVNLSLPRNVIALGLPLVLGTIIPSGIKSSPKGIQTGVDEIDQLLNALLSNSMFVGGLVGFFLDNTLPGNANTRESDTEKEMTDNRNSDLSSYDLPWVTALLRRQWWTRFVPVLPNPSVKSPREKKETNGRDSPSSV